ncbi:IclR family transcriptional regulator domain-containing protein [Malikia spinosa]|uniref:Helix-turn-helix domain-containing protein n=1 Tax=Malikia spinosa TaxID=86180 RepID=A0A7C9MU72_9BURK|nr:IclR family transcriptional regulator C-terminal domain-containing protein [Malikia spinosa]MYZ51617.1 helix-turn-helix domain-containing protein [Malikia spinosa]
MTIARADFIEGMAKGMAVLESFDTERQRLNATQAAQRAGLTRAAARRHLLTLAHLGYLESDGSHFWLSAKVLRFSGSYLASARLPRTVQPTLNRLAAQTRDAYSVAVLEGDAVVIVARSAAALAPDWAADWDGSSLATGLPAPTSARLMAYGLHLGARLPAHASSTGRVLLAALPEPELAAWFEGRVLARLTPYTVTDPGALRKILDQIRQQDCCIASEEHEIGVHAVAVPLRNLQGKTVGALNAVLTPARLARGAIQRELLPLLQDAARELRALL